MKNISSLLIVASIISLLHAADTLSQVASAAGTAPATQTAASATAASSPAPTAPAKAAAAATPSSTSQTAQASQSIYDIISTNPNLTTLSALLSAADLTDTLSKGNFTVFAPTDAAFNSLPAGTVEELMKPENKSKLLVFILYHIVAASLPTSQMKPGSLETANGSSLQVLPTPGAIKVNQAAIKTPDIKASNGYVDVIDTVLAP